MQKQQKPYLGALGALALSAALAVPATTLAGPTGIEAAAVERLRDSMSFLGRQQAFELEAHSTIEAVLVDGQKLQFDHATRGVVQRPDKLYAERLGELVAQDFIYDGKSLTLYERAAGVYATVDVPDTLEAMLDYARTTLDIVAPAGDFIYRDAFAILMEGVDSAFLVGPAFVEGVMCDHLAFSKPGTDFQVWIEIGERPLPRKLVITTRDVVNAPQFTVNIRSWDLDPEIPSGLFEFDPPEGALDIEFVLLGDESE